MLRLIKTFACILLVTGLALPARAFILWGPVNEAYQVRDLGFNIAERGDNGAPKNIGEEYRRNVPIVYYSFDQNFLDFYGAQGIASVDAAFAILNNLQGVSSYSTALTEFPLDSRRQNYRATALNLIDLKSQVLSFMMEQLGIGNATRYAWCLHDRNAGANCPNGNEYLITLRNFDIVPSALDQLQYSPSINGVLFTYFIREFCANPPFGSGLSEAIDLPVNPTDLDNSLPVATTGGRSFSIGLGNFYTGLTRDDVAGLRYLYRSNNVNWESLPNSFTLFQTNKTAANLSLIVTSNLNDLISASLTNTDAALQAIYPTLQILNTTPALTTVIVTNQIAFFTNYPWNPVGVATLVVTNSYTTNIIFTFQRIFGNVVTNFLDLPTGYVFTNNNPFPGTPTTSTWMTTITTNVGTATGTDPYGQPRLTSFTNVTSTTALTSGLSGDFFILPTNNCGFLLLSNVLTRVLAVTNTIVATNAISATNVLNATNISFFSQTFITYWTNHNFAFFPVLCQTNEVTLRRGIEHIQFVRRDFDSLIGQFFYPQTNDFNLTIVTNSHDANEFSRRVVNRPDFLFTAVDLAPGPTGPPLNFFDAGRSINYNTNNELAGLAGPGTIEPTTTITFNKSGPLFYNVWTNTLVFLDQLTQQQLPMWASFDDSTNAPTLYANGTSIEDLEAMILIQLIGSFPNGKVGSFYSNQLGASGGSGGAQGFSFSLAAYSPGLPPGLTLSPGGLISGTPSADGTYDFTLQVTDNATARFSLWDIVLIITP
jgi:hypothetical protein